MCAIAAFKRLSGHQRIGGGLVRSSGGTSIGVINPAAMLALAAGCCTYVSLLNPLTFQSRGPYAFVSASLPAAGVAALVYYRASLRVIRTGRGGYNQG